MPMREGNPIRAGAEEAAEILRGVPFQVRMQQTTRTQNQTGCLIIHSLLTKGGEHNEGNGNSARHYRSENFYCTFASTTEKTCGANASERKNAVVAMTAADRGLIGGTT